MGGDLVVVRRYPDDVQAAADQARLEAWGITALVVRDAGGNAFPLPDPMTPAQLVVQRADAAAARSLLERRGAHLVEAVSPMADLHPRLSELLRHVEAQRAALLAAVAGLDPAVRERRPAADAWSPGEVLDHLYRSEMAVVRILAKLAAAARDGDAGAESAIDSMLGCLDTYRIGDRSRVVPAPEMLLPEPDASADEALAHLERSRAALREVVADGNGLALGAVRFSHPLLGPLDGYQWLLFVGQHEARHAEQIREAGRAARRAAEPAAEC